jgi:ribosomal protein L10
MRNAYSVFTLRNQLVEGKKLPLADVAIKAKLQIASDMQLGKKTKLTADMRRMATIIANRHYKRAETFINSAASNSFPYSK